MPKAIADVFKAGSMIQTGAYRDLKGRKVVEVDGLDAFLKGIGFQPNSVAIVRRAERFVQQDVALFRAIKSDAAELWSRGVFERELEKIGRARELIRDWNSKNPGQPMHVKMSQVQRRVSEMQICPENGLQNRHLQKSVVMPEAY